MAGRFRQTTFQRTQCTDRGKEERDQMDAGATRYRRELARRRLHHVRHRELQERHRLRHVGHVVARGQGQYRDGDDQDEVSERRVMGGDL